MTIVSPMGQLRPVFADKNGKRLSGGKVYTYESGTLTPKATYTDALNLIPNTNPINLDESGEADIYLDGGYRMQVYDRYGVLIQDVDNFRTWASGIPAESIFYGSQDLKQFNASVEAAIEDRYTKAETYSKPEIDTSLTAIAGGHKAYQTLAAAQAAQATLPLNSIVEVTNDGDNNGTYQWNGTTLTKSAYDPLTQAKADATTKANAAENNAINYIDLKLVSFPERSGFISGICTNNGQILIAFRASDGYPVFANGQSSLDVIEALNTSLQSKFEVAASGRSGLLYGLKTPDGSLPFYIDMFSGTPILCGVDVLKEIEKLKNNSGSSVSDAVPDFPADDIFSVGDSLTAGGTTNWSTTLAELSGRQVYNAGIGGQGSRQIAARQGGVPVRFNAFTIPATATPVTVTTNGWTPCSNNGAAQQIEIAGVHGNLQLTAGVHTFSRLTAGTPVEVAQGTIGIHVIGKQYRNRTLIIGTGRNSFKNGSADYLSASQIVQIIRSMIDYQYAKVKRAIVWSIPPFPDDNSATLAQLQSVNDAIKAAFPEHWLDISAWLRTTNPVTIGGKTINDPFTYLGITPTAQDLTDITNGQTPLSLRNSETDGHFNATARLAIAYRFNEELKLKGWA